MLAPYRSESSWKDEKDIQVAILPSTAAVRLRGSDIPESSLSRLNTPFISLQYLDRLLLGTCDVGLAPTIRSSAVAMFDKKVATANLALSLAHDIWTRCWSVMFCHVDLQLLSISVCRRFPARFFGSGVEVIR